MKNKCIIFMVVFMLAGIACVIYVNKTHTLPLFKRVSWSIGIYTGDSPLNMSSPEHVRNPVLRAKDVKDIRAKFVADPFMIQYQNEWYMFFEILNKATGQGDIGVATSKDGMKWEYKQVVLDEPYHLSYPYVFKLDDEIYMLPESNRANQLRLYKAVDFPLEWELAKVLMEGNFTDSSLVQHDNKWWIFTETNPKGSDILSLYYADNLMGPWTEHPMSPIVFGNPDIARPGGRIVKVDNRIIRFNQDVYPVYGNQLRAFEVTELTPTSYQDRPVAENPVLNASGRGWNAKGMHHLDAHKIGDNQWIAAVDGWGGDVMVFGL